MASAAELKDRGNARFSAGDFEGAVALYTQAIELEPPGTAILFSNRANAYLKVLLFHPPAPLSLPLLVTRALTRTHKIK